MRHLTLTGAMAGTILCGKRNDRFATYEHAAYVANIDDPDICPECKAIWIGGLDPKPQFDGSRPVLARVKITTAAGTVREMIIENIEPQHDEYLMGSLVKMCQLLVFTDDTLWYVQIGTNKGLAHEWIISPHTQRIVHRDVLNGVSKHIGYAGALVVEDIGKQ